MVALEPPDIHYLRAAEGWLGLGSPAEALSELARLSPAARLHPDALGTQWRVHADQRQWPAALEIARELVARAPELPRGWVDQSYTLHELQRTREAFDILIPLAAKFPDLPVIPYNLACYACQLGELDKARHWLGRATKLQGKAEVQRLAIADRDLKPLWPEITAW